MDEAKVVERKNEIQSTLSDLHETKSKIEKGLIKVEAQNMMGEFDSPEIYKGVKRNLSSQLNTIKVKIERAQTELDQLGNHQLWFDWIDQFANEFASTNNFTPEKKKHLVNGVVKDILVNYDQAKKLHRVRVNFRLPVLRSVGEILRANNAVLKRGANSPKESQTLENTGAPETVRSALLYRNAFGQVSGLIHITTAHDGNMVRKQLQRNGGQNRSQAFFRIRDFNHMIRNFLHFGIAFGYNGNDLSFAGLYFLDVAEYFVVIASAGCNHHHRHVLID